MDEKRDAILARGAELVKNELLAHVEDALQVRTSMPIKDSELFGSTLLVHKDVLSEVKAKVRQRQDNVRKLIAGTGYYLEREGRGSEELPMDLTPLQRGRLNKLRDGESQLRLSFGTLAAVIEIFKRINLSMQADIQRLQANGDARSKSNAYLQNAILVYELSDFAIEHLSGFKAGGLDDIRAVRNEILAEIRQLEKDDEEVVRMTRGVTKAHADLVLREVADRKEFRRHIAAKWDQIMDRIDGKNSPQSELGKVLPSLELTRANAKARIGVLNLAVTTRLVDEAVNAIAELAESLPAWNLSPIDERTMRQLLNLELHDA